MPENAYYDSFSEKLVVKTAIKELPHRDKVDLFKALADEMEIPLMLTKAGETDAINIIDKQLDKMWLNGFQKK